MEGMAGMLCMMLLGEKEVVNDSKQVVRYSREKVWVVHMTSDDQS